MAKKVSVLGFLFLLSLLAVVPAFADGPDRDHGRGTGPVVYVPDQGLFYDSIVVVAPDPGLPMEGPFQKLEMAGPSGLQTEFGLGDEGYVGGRWWVDVNGDGDMNEGDLFFLCPLLGPGRTTQ